MAAYRIIHRLPRIFIARPAKYACSAGYIPGLKRVKMGGHTVSVWWGVI